MPFRLVPKSLTFDDLELLYVQIFSEFCASWRAWEATTAKRMKIARPALSVRELLRTESRLLFNGV